MRETELCRAGFRKLKAERQMPFRGPTPTNSRWKEPHLGATGSITRPSDFKLGSVESRAAARALLAAKADSEFDGPVLELDSRSSHFAISRDELLRDWVEEPDRYVKYETTDCAVRSIILKADTEALKRIFPEKYGNSL